MFGPRGGRNADRYNDEYDAMKSDYEESNQDYGISKNSRGRNSDEIKLHVSNIPAGLNEAGLANIFTSEDFQGFSPFIGRQNEDRDTAWGFINFKTLAEAQSAINAVHRMPPHNLYVKFARPKGEKPSQDKSDDSATEKETLGMNISRGRGMNPNEFPRKRSSSVPRGPAPVKEPYFGKRESPDSDFPSNKFLPPPDNYEIEVSNALNANLTIYDDGRRTVSMGRGSYSVPPTKTEPESRRSTSTTYSNNNEQYDFMLSSYLTSEYRSIKCEDNFKLVHNSDSPLMILFKLGPCILCARPSLYVCTICKSWYCSRACRKIDEANHERQCVPREVLGFKEDGTVKFSEGRGQFANAIETNGDVPSKPTRHYAETNSRDYQDNRQSRREPSPPRHDYGHVSSDHEPPSKNSYDNDYKRDNKGYSNSNDDDDLRSQRGGYASSQSGRGGYDNQRGRQRGGASGGGRGGKGGRGGHSSSQSDHQSSSDSPRENFNKRGNNARNGYDNHQENGTDDYSNQNGGSADPPARNERRLPKPVVPHVEDGVYKPPSGHQPPAPATAPVHSAPKNAPHPKAEPPIPFNAYSEVTVGAVLEDKKSFWAYPASSLEEQASIMADLGKLDNNSSAYNGPIKPGVRIVAPFSGDWYRAEIKGNGPEGTIAVFYIDFGNEAFVEKRDLKNLPSKYSSKSGLAHLFVLADSPNNPPLVDEANIKLKPVKPVGDGWLVHAEGVIYNKVNEEEVY